jgi:hypothetical protein
MRLFAIRKECGEMLILSAATEDEAVKGAGLDMETVHSVVAQLRAQGSTIDAETVIRGGIGPQSYEIRELPDICLEFKLDEIGELELADIDMETHETVYEMYPVISAAAEAAGNNWPGPRLTDEERRPWKQFMARAVEQERTRFRPSSGPVAT